MSISLKIFQKNVFNQGLKPFLADVRNLTTNISKYGLQSCEKLSGHEYKHLKQADLLGSADSVQNRPETPPFFLCLVTSFFLSRLSVCNQFKRFFYYEN